MLQPRILAILNILGLVLVLVLNAMANALPINGFNTGQVSAFYPNLFVPAGFTFSIWSLIYLMMIGFVAVSVKWMWHAPDMPTGKLAQAVSPLFLLTCLVNAGWILAWHYLMTGLSVFIMLVFLSLLILIYLKMQPFRESLSGFRKFFLYSFFIVYLGWISVATIANITALLVKMKWTGLGLEPAYWSLTMMAVAILLGLLFIVKKRDHAFAWVIAWALFGIHGAQSERTPAIGQLALAGIALLLAYSALNLYMDRRRRMA